MYSVSITHSKGCWRFWETFKLGTYRQFVSSPLARLLLHTAVELANSYQTIPACVGCWRN